jgi:uncharacterized protein YndB with AHSA1/START domain
MSTPIILEHSYKAAPARVWRALTDPEEVRQWYFDIPGFKAEVGHKFSFSGGDETKQYMHHCEILEVIPERKLSYTWAYEDFPGSSVVSFELFPGADGGTRVRITHSGLETFPGDRLPDFAPASFKGGWTYFLTDGFAKYLGEPAGAQ